MAVFVAVDTNARRLSIRYYVGTLRRRLHGSMQGNFSHVFPSVDESKRGPSMFRCRIIWMASNALSGIGALDN
jgi:hypothetical protein